MMCRQPQPIGLRLYAGLSARTNATNSIPCYIFMALAVVMVIAGIVMVCIKPKSNVMVFPNMPVAYNNVGESVSLYCPNCKNPIGQNDIFAKPADII